MPSESIQEQIIKLVGAAMLEITTANGFSTTVNSVQRREWGGVNLSQMPTVLIKEGESTVDLPQSSHQRVRRSLTLNLVLAVPPPEEGSALSGAEVLNALACDIELMVGANQQWSGLALMTEPPNSAEESVEAETPHLSRGMQLTIVFEHLRLDPRAQ